MNGMAKAGTLLLMVCLVKTGVGQNGFDQVDREEQLCWLAYPSMGKTLNLTKEQADRIAKFIPKAHQEISEAVEPFAVRLRVGSAAFKAMSRDEKLSALIDWSQALKKATYRQYEQLTNILTPQQLGVLDAMWARQRDMSTERELTLEEIETLQVFSAVRDLLEMTEKQRTDCDALALEISLKKRADSSQYRSWRESLTRDELFQQQLQR